jgi:hypothetical protein
MSLAVALSVRFFIAAVLILLAAFCLYHYIRSLLVDRTYAEECIARWQKRASHSKTPVYYESPTSEIYLTVIYHITTRLEVTRERVRFICEFLSSKLGGRQFEILCFVSPENLTYFSQAVPLRQQFPQVAPIGANEAPMTIRSFTCAALKARGIYLVEASSLEIEVAKLPKEINHGYLSFLDPMPELLYFNDLEALVLVAAAKMAALELLTSVHVAEFGLARELKIIAGKKALVMNIEQKKMKTWNRSTSYWVANKVAAAVIPLMYGSRIWVVR